LRVRHADDGDSAGLVAVEADTLREGAPQRREQRGVVAGDELLAEVLDSSRMSVPSSLSAASPPRRL